MAKYQIKYNEGNHINKSIELEAESMHDAVVYFTLKNVNADIVSVQEVE